MYDAQYYPGHEELRQYVNNNKHPSFDSFTLANLEKIAQWSTTIYTTDRDILFQTWFGRFTKLLRSQKPHLATRKLKLNKKLWTTVAEMRD
ncbi:hypothetical protein BCR42DRAFT_61742 [Absidia repens]|uniref:Uncharacterized protein n=1 Tax=Absidia repens TaxID=90262 RepID=A0A1X2IEA1_9FUNG|nr:hypothetical protein BCR42DRAFT_61742 [Absidia repens]